MLVHYFFLLLHSCNMSCELHVFVMVWFFYSSLENSSLFGLDSLFQLSLAIPHCLLSFAWKTSTTIFDFLIKICSQPIKKGWCSRIPNLKESLFLPSVNNHNSKKLANDQEICEINHNSHRKMNKNESQIHKNL